MKPCKDANCIQHVDTNTVTLWDHLTHGPFWEPMSSTYSPRWRRLLYHVPGLFLKCPEGNYHWRWSKYCQCADANEKPRFVYSMGKWWTIREEEKPKPQSDDVLELLADHSNESPYREVLGLLADHFEAREPPQQAFTNVPMTGFTRVVESENRQARADAWTVRGVVSVDPMPHPAGEIFFHDSLKELEELRKKHEEEKEPRKSLWDHLKG